MISGFVEAAINVFFVCPLARFVVAILRRCVSFPLVFSNHNVFFVFLEKVPVLFFFVLLLLLNVLPHFHLLTLTH